MLLCIFAHILWYTSFKKIVRGIVMVKYIEKDGMFNIETKNTSYVFCLDKLLQNVYWGDKLHGEDCDVLFFNNDYTWFSKDICLDREEATFWDGTSFLEPCVKVNFKDKRVVKMGYINHTVEKIDDIERICITFKNSFSDLYIDLYYDIYTDYDIISRYIEVRNEGEEAQIEILKSAALTIPQLNDYRVTYMTGRWSGEGNLKEQNLQIGEFKIQGKRGMTGFQFNPSFALDDGTASEKDGDVWFGMLGYSGNWSITFEKTVLGDVYITGGLNDFDFSKVLMKGESIRTPEFMIGFSAEGFGGMSRKLHAFQYDNILPNKRKSGRILYNGWEASGFDVSANTQKNLANIAAEMGVELFVIDDGWFGTRNSEDGGMGDWSVSKDKFPNGLSELIDHVKGLGMDFGIWVEPEAVSPNTDLYKEHPDWIYRFDGIEPTKGRNQYLLNISKPEVKEFILDFMTDLLSNHDISYIKWDRNREMTDVSMTGDLNKDKELWHNHIEALYDIWRILRERFPNVEFEVCAGGGGRIDLGIFKYADQSWPSDNTFPRDRLFIQEGYSYFYNIRSMTSWVTNKGNMNGGMPLNYRFHVSMMGGLAIGSKINLLSEEERAEYKKYIAQYKEIRETIQFGKQYRLSSPRKSDVIAVEYVSNDDKEVVLFVFSQDQKFWDFIPRIKLQGLEKDAKYVVEGFDGEIYGDSLMKAGIPVDLKGYFNSTMIKIRRV